MVVLAHSSSSSSRHDAESQQQQQLWCVLGPYWMILLFVTLPGLAALSFWVAIRQLPDHSIGVIVAWSICTGTMFIALLLTGCRDPGILRRVRQMEENDNDDSSNSTTAWRWNDQGQTYRPASAKYDAECACVIAGFDHTCPWTGTAIGKKNMTTFKLFLAALFASLATDVVLLVFL